MSLIVVVEGRTDEPVVRKLAADAGLEVADVLPMRGKGRLDQRLGDFNTAAVGSPWFVLRDLDHDAACAPTYLEGLQLQVTQWMVFRLAVRELESWLLADRDGIAEYLGVALAKVPERPDELDDPKQTLVNLARTSKKKSVTKAFVPRAGDSTVVGPLYEAEIIEFSSSHWSLQAACRRSPSLRRARRALRDMCGRWSRHIRGGGA
jgi:hypothetical protein